MKSFGITDDADDADRSSSSGSPHATSRDEQKNLGYTLGELPSEEAALLGPW